MLRINLRFAGLENPGGALLVTSAVRREGKTMTAVNLAATFAQAGKRVFLVDANLRNPALHKVFNLPNQVGLSNLLSGDKTTLDQVKQPTGLNGLFLIPSGPTPPNPTELLDSEQMDRLMTGLRADSDMVILDGTSLAGFADAAVAGARCSGAVVVVDSTHTRGALSRDAIETLSRSNIKVFGVVLNKTGKSQVAR